MLIAAAGMVLTLLVVLITWKAKRSEPTTPDTSCHDSHVGNVELQSEFTEESRQKISNELRPQLRMKREPRLRQRTSSKSGLGTEVSLFGLLPRVFVVVDLETTGLSWKAHEIIEVGAIRVTLGEFDHQTYQALVRPTGKITKRITALTGISQTMVDVDGIELSQAIAEFLNFAGNAPLVTYNATFDLPFLRRAAEQHGFDLKNQYACALECARKAFPNLENHRLVHVSEMLGLSETDHHRALADCIRAAHVFCASTGAINKKVRWSRHPDA